MIDPLCGPSPGTAPTHRSCSASLGRMKEWRASVYLVSQCLTVWAGKSHSFKSTQHQAPCPPITAIHSPRAPFCSYSQVPPGLLLQSWWPENQVSQPSVTTITLGIWSPWSDGVLWPMAPCTRARSGGAGTSRAHAQRQLPPLPQLLPVTVQFSPWLP